jgi:hypothetical protein
MVHGSKGMSGWHGIKARLNDVALIGGPETFLNFQLIYPN